MLPLNLERDHLSAETGAGSDPGSENVALALALANKSGASSWLPCNSFIFIQRGRTVRVAALYVDHAVSTLVSLCGICSC